MIAPGLSRFCDIALRPVQRNNDSVNVLSSWSTGNAENMGIGEADAILGRLASSSLPSAVGISCQFERKDRGAARQASG